MIAVVLVALTVALFAAVGLYARAKGKARDRAERLDQMRTLIRDIAAADPYATEADVARMLARAVNDPVAAGGFRMSSPAVAVKPSRGVDRVPERLKVERTTPLPAPILPGSREVRGGRWVMAPYRNPDRLARLAKNGRLRAELRPG